MKMVVLNSSVGPKVHVLEFKSFFIVAGFEWISSVSVKISQAARNRDVAAVSG